MAELSYSFKNVSLDGLDENGKAVFGTPGPGTYQPASSFGKPLVYNAAPTYAFGTREFELQRQSYISQEHSKDRNFEHAALLGS